MADDNSIHRAAATGDGGAIRALLRADATLATRADSIAGWDPLTHLCFSEQLRDREHSDRFVDAARALLTAGAPASTGFTKGGMFESALYGAAGVARDAALTRVLLEHGADPNDDEVPYHAGETYDNAVVQALIDSGRLNADSLATMLLRKCDWHDGEGIALLLKHGADPNRMTPWGYTAFHQAIRRDNHIAIVSYLLDQGADPLIAGHGRTALVMAAWNGRGDVLQACRDRGIAIEFDGLGALVAACALGDESRVNALAQDAALVVHLRQHEGALLGAFAGVGNTTGIAHLLDLGANVNAMITIDDGYWQLAKHSTPLHVAAWRARHEIVKLLVARGAAVNAEDAKGQTPLTLAVRACVDSYWSDERQPDSVLALLKAGAVVPTTIALPTGYGAIDALLMSRVIVP
jgi:ankyrin repeat protein